MRDGVLLVKLEGNGCLSARLNGACAAGVLAVGMHKSQYASHARHATILHRSGSAILPAVCLHSRKHANVAGVVEGAAWEVVPNGGLYL